MDKEKSPKKGKKARIWLIVAAVIAVLLFVQYLVDGPAHGSKQAAKLVEQLKEDSVALNGNLSPVGTSYTAWQDVSAAVDDIYRLGEPLRFHGGDAYWETDPATASLVAYNREKCREVLAQVLPQWRRAFALALHHQPETVVSLEGNDATVIEVYSTGYTDEDKVKSAYRKLRGAMAKLGFKKAVFGYSPVSPTYTYDL